MVWQTKWLLNYEPAGNEDESHSKDNDRTKHQTKLCKSSDSVTWLVFLATANNSQFFIIIIIIFTFILKAISTYGGIVRRLYRNKEKKKCWPYGLSLAVIAI